MEKANLALEMMVEGEGNRLMGMKFVGANKEKGLGGVLYKLNSGEAAKWLKEKATIADFLSKMGSTLEYKEQMYKVVVDWIPILLEVDQPYIWRAIEQTSGIRCEAIKEVTWIKPIHLHAAGQ